MVKSNYTTAEQQEIAQTIALQMGGTRRLAAFVNAKNWLSK